MGEAGAGEGLSAVDDPAPRHPALRADLSSVGEVLSVAASKGFQSATGRRLELAIGQRRE
jgi:hypothetical protein